MSDSPGIASATHRLICGDARDRWPGEAGDLQLVVTSPPYPMIAMWDESFARWKDPDAPPREVSPEDFEWLHCELDRVWANAWHALCEGGFLIVNIGDATRSIDKTFRLFSNHARIIQGCVALGFNVLPGILWRKPTNAPNKFMGSGMLPGGAYVTLEHEHILIFRKGDRRAYDTDAERHRRRQSAIFWEERNVWFSDVWQDIRGERQAFGGGGTRSRSGAFPFEFAYRLVNMFSVQGDRVCDPFIGTGTTALAAIASARSCLGIEIDPELHDVMQTRIGAAKDDLNGFTTRRSEKHDEFVQARAANEKQKSCAHFNEGLAMPVMTSQERDLQLPWIDELSRESVEEPGVWRSAYRRFLPRNSDEVPLG